jgi:chemotaxis protein MotB
MAGKGGGAWKVAYADFVTAMMAFFMVMWLVGQKEGVKEAVASYFSDPYAEHEPVEGQSPSAPPTGHGKGDGPKLKKDSPSKDPHDEESKKPRVLTIHGPDRTAVGALIVFAEDSAELDDEGRQQINRILPKLAGMPQKIEVRGHASRRGHKASDEQVAWQISYQRCLTVMNYLQEQGIEPNRIRLTQAGVHEPFTIRSEADVQPRNSRVEVFLLAELAEDLVGTAEERAARFHEQTAQPATPAPPSAPAAAGAR